MPFRRPPIRSSSPGAAVQGEAQRALLGNGLRVVSITLPHLHSCLVAVYLRCGSRYEPLHANGISHLLEHLVLRGGAAHPHPQEVAAAIESAGGELQGATARDHTVLQTVAHPSRLEAPFEVLGDLLGRPLLEDLELEREVIHEELLSDVDEEGLLLDTEELSLGRLFLGHPLGRPIGGTFATLAALRSEDLRAWHAAAYGARNMIAVCAGPATHEQVVQLADEFLGQLPPGQLLPDGPPPPRPPGLPAVLVLDRRGAQTELRLSFRCAPQRDPSFSHLRVLRRILADGPSSLLQQALVERRALAYAVGASLSSFSDCAVFSVSAVCTPDKGAALGAHLLQLLGELRTTDVSPEALARVRLAFQVRSDFMLDSPAAAAERFGLGELLHAPVPSEEPSVRELEAVTAADVRRAANGLFDQGGLVACIAGPPTCDTAALRRVLTEGSGLAG